MHERTRRILETTVVMALGCAVTLAAGHDTEEDMIEPSYTQVTIPLQVPEIGQETEEIIIDEFATTVEYWRQEGVDVGDTTLRVLEVGQYIMCGDTIGGGDDQFSVYYCRVDNSVVISEAFADMVTHIEPAGERETGVFALVVAHEVAHAVQAATTPRKSKLLEQGNGMLIELQADCMAGQVMDGASERRIGGATDFFTVVASNTDPWHGTEEERLAAFHLGLGGGSCTTTSIRQVI